jgi:hypothetical protein
MLFAELHEAEGCLVTAARVKAGCVSIVNQAAESKAIARLATFN